MLVSQSDHDNHKKCRCKQHHCLISTDDCLAILLPLQPQLQSCITHILLPRLCELYLWRIIGQIATAVTVYRRVVITDCKVLLATVRYQSNRACERSGSGNFDRSAHSHALPPNTVDWSSHCRSWSCNHFHQKIALKYLIKTICKINKISLLYIRSVTVLCIQ